MNLIVSYRKKDITVIVHALLTETGRYVGCFFDILRSVVNPLRKYPGNWASVRMTRGGDMDQNGVIFSKNTVSVPFENLMESEKDHDRRIDRKS